MPRNSDDARQRLQLSALELFGKYGFEQATAAQIAAHAGVTERTFFRHFPDKREVLFEGQAVFASALTAAVEATPMGLPPMEVLRQAFRGITPLLEGNRPFSEPRQRIIAADASLQERESAKHAALVKLVAELLRARNVSPLEAALAAEAGMAVLSQAIAAWFADPSQKLDHCVDVAFAALQRLTAA